MIQVVYTQLSKKGLVTIPKEIREQLDLDPRKQPLIKVYRDGLKVVIEAVKLVDISEIREYSNAQIDQFITADRLTPSQRRNAKKYLKNLS